MIPGFLWLKLEALDVFLSSFGGIDRHSYRLLVLLQYPRCSPTHRKQLSIRCYRATRVC